MLHQQQLTHRKSSNVLKTVQWINFLNKSLKIRAGDSCSNNTIILAKLDNPHRLYLLRNNLFYMIPLFVLGQTIFLVTENIVEPLPITKCEISKEYKSQHVLSITNDMSSSTGINRLFQPGNQFLIFCQQRGKRITRSKRKKVTSLHLEKSGVEIWVLKCVSAS